VLSHVVDEEVTGDALADGAALEVGERHDHGVHRAFGDERAQCLNVEHAALYARLRPPGRSAHDPARPARGAPGGYLGRAHRADHRPHHYYATARFGRWDRPAAFLANEYFELVAAAGARPVLLPPCRMRVAGPGGAADVVAALDGLVLVEDPISTRPLRGAAAPRSGGAEPVRDESERALAEAALDADLPVLAICRGLQLVNVVLGGTLHQHVPDIVEHREHQPEGAPSPTWT